MVEGLKELLILEGRGIICHLWQGDDPCYEPIDADENHEGIPLPHDREEYRYCFETSAPPFVGYKEPFEWPYEADRIERRFGPWNLHVVSAPGWFGDHEPEWVELQRLIHKELAERCDALGLPSGRRQAHEAIAALVEQLPPVPQGITRRSKWYLLTTGPQDHAPVVLSDLSAFEAAGVQSAALVLNRAAELAGNEDAEHLDATGLLARLVQGVPVIRRVNDCFVTLHEVTGRMVALRIETPTSGIPFAELERRRVLGELEQDLVVTPLGLEAYEGWMPFSPAVRGLEPIMRTYAVSPHQDETAEEYIEHSQYAVGPRYHRQVEQDDNTYFWMTSQDGMHWASGEPEQVWLIGPSADPWGDANRVFDCFFDSRAILATQQRVVQRLADLETEAEVRIRELAASADTVARRTVVGELERINMELTQFIPLLTSRLEFATRLAGAREKGQPWAELAWWEQDVPGMETDILHLCQASVQSADALSNRVRQAAESGTRQLQVVPGVAHHLRVADFGSFSKAGQVDASDVAEHCPLDLLEDTVKERLRETLGEPWEYEHWAGEQYDLLCNHVVLNDEEMTGAFLLKGRGVQRPLRISDLGTNGDQIVRLTSHDSQAYFVVHVNRIGDDVQAHLRAQAEEAARRQGRDVYYCCVNGCELARIFMAYGYPLDEQE